MRSALIITCILSVASVTACKQDVVSQVSYSCADKKTIKTTFTNGEMVDIVDGETTIRLPRVESASGAKYEGDEAVFWVKGKDAQYTPGKGGKAVDCTRGY